MVSVNGRSDGEEGLVPSEKQEELPFIVVAAAAVENDASSDPNEAFIPTKVLFVVWFLTIVI